MNDQGRMTDLPDAESAWEKWLNSPEQEFKANHDHASFLAGFAAASERTSNEPQTGSKFDLPDAVVELTEDERAELDTWAREGIYHCPCRMRCMCDDEDKVYLFDAVESIVAARLAAASGPWAEHLDAANAERDEWKKNASDAQRIIDATHAKNVELRAELAAALARNAELEKAKTHWHMSCKGAEAEAEALRAELDNLRDRVTALADAWDEHPNTAVIRETAAKRLRAIVRGSDDAEGDA